MSTLAERRAASVARLRAQRKMLVPSMPSIRTDVSPTVVKPSGAGIRKRKCKMTGAQRNSEGRMSEWSMSQDFFTDPKWSQTVRSQNV